MKTYKIPQKPHAPTAEDEHRQTHSAMRRRLLEGTYEQDLEDEMLRHWSSDRNAIMVPDLSSNVLEQVTRQLACLYDAPPTVTHSQGEDISKLVSKEGYTTKAGLFPLMATAQQYILALRECFVRIDVIDSTPGQITNEESIQYRIVTPDFVYCESNPDAPDIPLYYQELRLRLDPETKEPVYIADCIDIRDPQNPSFGMFEVLQNGDLGNDVTDRYLGRGIMKGEEYPYKTKEGRPFLPLVMYRAEKTGKLWSAYKNSQIVYGALTASVLMSFFLHICKNCSYPQRYVLGAGVQGLSNNDVDTTARRQTVSTDPSSILMFYSDPETTGQPLIGQFQAGADPDKMLEAIAKYELRVATASGISSANVLRTDGDPRSGYSLSVSREGQRTASRKLKVTQSHYDEILLSKSACMANIYFGANLPESGYRIQYAPIPRDPVEMKEIREDIIAKMENGLISPIQAMQLLHPDLDDEGARQMLLKIKRERAELM